MAEPPSSNVSMELPITFFLALSLSVLLTYKVRSWAVRLGIVDLPDTVRRFHSRPTPRAGGVGIFVSFALVVALAWARGHIDLGGDEMFARQFLALTLG